jgi:hypothetical protein
VIEQLPEHELAYGSEPAWERGEGEAVAEQQPPRAPFLARQMSKWFYDTSTGAVTEAARCGSFVGGAQIAQGVGY